MITAWRRYVSPLRVYLAAIVVVSMLLIVASLPWLMTAHDENLSVLSLTTLVALASMHPLKLRPHLKLALRTVPEVMVVVLLSPPAALVATGSGVFLGYGYLLARRQCSGIDLLFNSAQSVLYTAVASVLYQAGLRFPIAIMQQPFALVLAATAIHGTNLLLVTGALTISGQSVGVGRTFLQLLRFYPLQHTLLLVIGLLGALVLQASRWAIVPFLLTLVLIHRIFVALRDDAARYQQMAADQARLHQDAAAALQLRDDFLTLAAHELKTPITTLLASIHLLRHRPTQALLTPNDQRTLQVLAEQGTRLHRLSQTLLDVSHLDTSTFALRSQPVDLCALTHRLVDELQHTLAYHSLHLLCHPDSITIDGDEVRLEQVLDNLLLNAVKYSPAGGPILVRVEQRSHEACVVVRDQGLGIPQHMQARIFERYYQAPAGAGRPSSGLGLGLYIVNEVVTRHGGRVELMSAEGRGSTFTVYLPLRRETGPG